MAIINAPLTLENVLRSTFDRGLSEKEYYLVLALLKPYVPEPMLVHALSAICERDYCSVYADLLQSRGKYVPTLVDSTALLKRLDKAGFFDWLKEAHIVEP